MKYLRIYENYNQYYHEVNIAEFREKPDISFEYKSVVNLKKIVIDNKFTDAQVGVTYYGNVNKRLDFNNFLIDRSSSAPYPYSIDFITFNSKSYGIDLFMSNDEWFKVSLLKFGDYLHKRASEQKYYLCDQWEGLIQLFKDKEII